MSISVKINIKSHRDRGYSLIELIVVIAITSILAGISVPSLINWKYFQDIKTRQLALKTNLEQMKSDAKRWGATCTINGKTMKSSCASAVLQKSVTDKFDMQSSQEVVIDPTVSKLKKDQSGKLIGEEYVFTATNFNKITFTPRGFIHVDPIRPGDSQAVFILGYKRNTNPFSDQAPELCVIVENLTGRIGVKRRDSQRLGRITITDSIYAESGLSC